MPDDSTPTTPAPERPPFTTESAQHWRDRLSGPLRGRGAVSRKDVESNVDLVKSLIKKVEI